MCPNDHLPWFHPNCPARPSTCHHQCVWTTNHVVPTLARLFHIDRSNLEASGYLSPLLMTRPTIYWHVYDSPQWKANICHASLFNCPIRIGRSRTRGSRKEGEFFGALDYVHVSYCGWTLVSKAFHWKLATWTWWDMTVVSSRPTRHSFGTDILCRGLVFSWEEMIAVEINSFGTLLMVPLRPFLWGPLMSRTSSMIGELVFELGGRRF